MRISQSMAKEIAKEALSPKWDKILELQKELKIKATEIAKSRIPKEVLVFYEKYPKFINTTDQIRLYGNGVNGNWYYIENIPCAGGYTNIEPTASEAEIIIKLSDKLEDENREYKSLKSELFNSINALRTVKMVSEQIPEIAHLLPKENKTSIVVVSEKLRESVSQINS